MHLSQHQGCLAHEDLQASCAQRPGSIISRAKRSMTSPGRCSGTRQRVLHREWRRFVTRWATPMSAPAYAHQVIGHGGGETGAVRLCTGAIPMAMRNLRFNTVRSCTALIPMTMRNLRFDAVRSCTAVNPVAMNNLRSALSFFVATATNV